MADKKLKIIFTADARYDTVPPVDYRKGQIEEMREDLATRWLKRGVASADPALISDAEAALKAGAEPVLAKPTEVLPEGVPANWRTLNARDSIALAVDVLKVRATEAGNRAQAQAAIAAKVEEANKPAE